MPAAKTHADPQPKTASAAAPTQQPALPEKQAGPQRASPRPILPYGPTGVSAPLNEGSAAQRARAMRAMQGTLGAARVSRMLAPIVQPKLTAGAPNDVYEQEAEQVADKIMRAPMPMDEKPWTEPAPRRRQPCPACQNTIQRQEHDDGLCPECRARLRQQKTVQRQAVSSQAPEVALETESYLKSAQGGGRPLPAGTRKTAEAHLGRDFRDVRVHDDAAGHAAAQSLSARAFTHGSDIFLARGESANDRRLMGHELTHVVQQGGGLEQTGPSVAVAEVARAAVRRQPVSGLGHDAGVDHRVARAPTSVVRRSNVDVQLNAAVSEEPVELDQDETFADEFFDELYDELVELEESEDCSNQTYAQRAYLLIEWGGWPPPTNDEEADAYREWLLGTAADEDLTLDELGLKVADLEPSAFPETWAFWIYEALAIEKSVQDNLFVQMTERFADLQTLAAGLPTRLWEEGLPLTFEEAQAGRPFHLLVSHAQLTQEGAVKEYARAALPYTRALWHLSFVGAWNSVAQNVADAVRACTHVPDAAAYYDFLDNYSEILASLPDRLSERWDQEGLEEIESSTLALADAALVAGAKALLGSLMGILSGWAGAAKQFNGALAGADELVVSADDLDKFLRALAWANRHGYFGAAGEQIVNALLEQGLEILGWTLAVIVAQVFPGLNVAVNTVLLITSGVDLAATLESLASVILAVFGARTIRQLQTASTQLATALLGDGLLALVDLGLVAFSLQAAKRQAREIRRRNPELSEEEALRQALRKSDEAGRALARASDFEEWESTLSHETRQALQQDSVLRQLYATMDRRVRQLLTLCESDCIPTKPRPRPEDLTRIEQLLDRLGLPANHRGLREYLHYNKEHLSDAVKGFDDIGDLNQLNKLLDADIARYATTLKGSAMRVPPDGRWQFTTKDGLVVEEYEVHTYGYLSDNRGTEGFFQAHHGAQDKWAELVGVPGYSQRGAKAILLRDSRTGSPHRIVTDRQFRRRGDRKNRTYEDERKLTHEDLSKAEVPPKTIDSYMAEQDKYFGELYDKASSTYSEAQLQRWFGNWKP